MLANKLKVALEAMSITILIYSTLSALFKFSVFSVLSTKSTKKSSLIVFRIPSNSYHIVVKTLQKEDGSFSGDQWGEIDTRFSYIALCTLALLQRLDAVNVDKAVEFILRCKNFDGGFGCVPGAESHAGQSKYFQLEKNTHCKFSVV